MKISSFIGTVLTIITIVVLSASPVLAQPGIEGPGAGTSTAPSTFALQNPLKVNSIGGLIQEAVVVFSYIVVIFAVLALVYVGLKFILARGNPEELSRLKEWLLWIVIGVAIVIGARVIVSVVINTLESSGVVDERVIQSARDAAQRR
jgi:uncharacterized protein involved in response to NO